MKLYCDSVWSCCNKCATDRLGCLQRQAARIVSMSDSSDTAMQINWNTLESRSDITNTVPQFLQNYFTFNQDVIPRRTRQSNCLRIPQVRTKAAKRTLFVMTL